MFFDAATKKSPMRAILPKFLLPLIIALLAGCSLAPKKTDTSQSGSANPEAEARYQQGLSHYRDNRFSAAFSDFDAAVATGNLPLAQTIDARKHLAFIHCANNREAPCREQFQAILKLDANFDLSPNEASHPGWGPVWRSIKGALEDRRAVARGGRFLASTAQQKLAEGIKEYDAGQYDKAINALQISVANKLTDKADQVRAYKYTAFASCLLRKNAQCHGAFRTIFSLDPAFALLPSEARHPAWATVYRKEKAATRRSRTVMQAVRP